MSRLQFPTVESRQVRTCNYGSGAVGTSQDRGRITWEVCCPQGKQVQSDTIWLVFQCQYLVLCGVTCYERLYRSLCQIWNPGLQGSVYDRISIFMYIIHCGTICKGLPPDHDHSYDVVSAHLVPFCAAPSYIQLEQGLFSYLHTLLCRFPVLKNSLIAHRAWNWPSDCS